MIEWDTVISVLGTLIGTLSGLMIGIWVESRREKHETSMEYRRELIKHMDDIIKPLYQLVEQQWQSLMLVEEYVKFKVSIAKGKTLDDLISNANKSWDELKEFLVHKGTEMNLIFPKSLSSWVFVPIGGSTKTILDRISKGEEPIKELTNIINALMKYQKNLKTLIGYEPYLSLENIYPFE